MTVLTSRRSGVTVVICTGVLSPGMLREIATQIDDDMATGGYQPVLIDLRAVETTDVGYAEMSSHAERRARDVTVTARHRQAILVALPVLFGLGRMYALLRGRPQLEIEVFTDETEALAWLGVENAHDAT
jgi:hypothetical protein